MTKEQLAALSEAASEGTEPTECWNAWDDFTHTLVNAYRSGDLVLIDRAGLRERVAKLLCVVLGDDPDREGPWLEWWQESPYASQATAAIAAILGEQPA